MNLSNFRLRDLRQRDIALFFIVVTLLIAIVWLFYLYRPAQTRISQLESDIDQLDVQIELGETARRNLPNLRLEVAQLEQERLEFLAELPRESEVANLIDLVRQSASDSDVVIESLSRGTVSENIDNVRPIGFSLATSGTYGETMTFLGTLENLRRFTKIQRIGLSVPEDTSSDPDLNANFDFTVYVFTGEDPGER